MSKNNLTNLLKAAISVEDDSVVVLTDDVIDTPIDATIIIDQDGSVTTDEEATEVVDIPSVTEALESLATIISEAEGWNSSTQKLVQLSFEQIMGELDIDPSQCVGIEALQEPTTAVAYLQQWKAALVTK